MGREKLTRLATDITSLETHVEKTKVLINKHKTQLEKMKVRGDSDYMLRSKEENITNAERKLTGYVERLEKAVEKFDAEKALVDLIEKEAPTVLIDFTYKWKDLALDWHVHQVNEYVKLRKVLLEKQHEVLVATMKELPEYESYFTEDGEVDISRLKNRMFYIQRNPVIADTLRENSLDDKSVKRRLAPRTNKFTSDLVRLSTDHARKEWLEPHLERERVAKLEDLFFRIYDVTGTIVEGSSLDISAKGNLDGVIVGEKATVKVDTISAGGYNIQCFHYRTLVKPMK